MEAWREFLNGKRSRKDVQSFELNLMENIISLHDDLTTKKYEHFPYQAFNISDPKPRNIHKASVRDRLLHHAIYRILYPFFDNRFISDSYSCRLNKGTLKAINEFRAFAYKVSSNHTKTIWVLKCDIRKFFASIDHKVLLEILSKHMSGSDTIWLFSKIINSFSSTREGIGLPLGNLASQLLVNIYMNEFDQFVKHKLRAKYYIRYADDFVVMSQDQDWLENILLDMKKFLLEKLKLDIHPNKVFIKTFASGVDFPGWVHFPNHRVLRTSTKNKMIRRLKEANNKPNTIQSYIGMLKHGNGYKLAKYLL